MIAFHICDTATDMRAIAFRPAEASGAYRILSGHGYGMSHEEQKRFIALWPLSGKDISVDPYYWGGGTLTILHYWLNKNYEHLPLAQVLYIDVEAARLHYNKDNPVLECLELVTTHDHYPERDVVGQ